MELFDSSLNIQGDFLISISFNGLEKKLIKRWIKKEYKLDLFFDDFFFGLIKRNKSERKYKDKKDLIICEFFPKKNNKNELNFDTELINYFKYLRLNIIYKSQINYEDLLLYIKEKRNVIFPKNLKMNEYSKTANPKIVSHLSCFFSLETNFDNVKIIKFALNEALERSKLNKEEYMNV